MDRKYRKGIAAIILAADGLVLLGEREVGSIAARTFFKRFTAKCKVLCF